MYKYKGFTIMKTFRYGYSYWKIVGNKQLFSTLKAAKFYIDEKEGV